MAFDKPGLEVEFLAFLVKKLTVSGIIGKTHGVSSAKSPPRNPRPKIRHSVFCRVRF